MVGSAIHKHDTKELVLTAGSTHMYTRVHNYRYYSVNALYNFFLTIVTLIVIRC